MTQPIRVLVVDDSAFARKVLREVLHAAGIEIVGTARDGLEALEQIATLKPDVVTLDLMMPNLDGVGVLRALSGENPPRVVVVSTSPADSSLGVEALQAGAVFVVRKPTAHATDQLYELGAELVRAIQQAALARNVSLPASVAPLPPQLARAMRCKLVVIGTSTGGPQALSKLLPALGKDFPVPIAIALHIPAGYTEELAKRLDRTSAVDVVEAHDGLVLRPGLVVLARGGSHMIVSRSEAGLVVHLSDDALREGLAPSVDVLFESAARLLGADVLGVVLTGMGVDGLAGARAIREGGGRVITEAETSCVVYGMPRAVKEAQLADAEAPLVDMALTIARHL